MKERILNLIQRGTGLFVFIFGFFFDFVLIFIVVIAKLIKKALPQNSKYLIGW
jgi:hypothetical protein